MPVTDGLPTCGRADSDGEIRDRIQSNGRCESANPRGDTYGPVAYLAYVPGGPGIRLERALGRAPGRPRDRARLRPPRARRPRARRPAVRRRPARGDPRLRLGGVSVHGVRASSNTNDAIMPAVLVWGFWLASSPVARGAALALAALDEVRGAPARAALARLPVARLRRRSVARFAAAFGVATVAAFSVLLLEPSLADAARDLLGPDGRVPARARLAVLDLGLGPVPRDGIPDLASLQTVVQVCTIALAGVAAARPRARKARSSSPRSPRPSSLAFELVAHALVVPLPSMAAPVRAPRPVCPAHAGPPRRRRCAAAAASRRCVASAVFVGARGRRDGRLGALRRRDHGHPALPHIRRADRGRPRAVPRLPRSSTRLARCPALVLPALVTDSLEAYRVVFVAELAIVGALAVLALDEALRRPGAGDRDRRGARPSWRSSPSLLGGVILTRFDLIPAALVAASAALLVAGRLRAASLVVGVGIAVKLYPAVLVPLLGSRRLATRRPARGARGRRLALAPARSGLPAVPRDRRRTASSIRSGASSDARSRSRASAPACCSRFTTRSAPRSAGRRGVARRT